MSKFKDHLFKSFLLNKLMKEIMDDLKNEYKEDLGYDKDRYDIMIDSITENYFKNHEISFKEEEPEEEEKENNKKEKCAARKWNHGYGDHQCTRKVFDCKNNLCKKHNDLFTTDKLWLGLITESRPEKPKRNGKVKKWKD